MKNMIIEILTYMKEHLSDELTIEEIADHFGYSKYHFSREFKKHTGFSASDYLSSLKIEKAKQELLKKDHSITNSSFDVGYSSLGTFSTTFTKKTGLSPREYKEQVESLYGLTKEYERQTAAHLHYASTHPSEASSNQLTVSLNYPKDIQPAIIFVGLFHRPIPNHKPVVGTALTNHSLHTFTQIPDGQYYLLACAIEKTKNPLKYFVLSDCLRGKVEEPLSFPEASHKEISLTLREPLPEDPPILINLPKLLADSLKSRNP
jgi:AraC-like DNA-binding protein